LINWHQTFLSVDKHILASFHLTAPAGAKQLLSQFSRFAACFQAEIRPIAQTLAHIRLIY
jgi:hypothetical protein